MTIMAYCINCNTEYSMKKNDKTGCPGCSTPLKSCKRFRINISTPGGKRLTKTVNGNLTLARRVEAKLKTEAGELKHLGIRKAPPINEVWDKYIKWAEKNKKSWKDDASRWKYHVKRHVEGKKMDQLMANDIQAILNKMVKYKSGFYKKPGKTQSQDAIQHVKQDETGTHAPATVKQTLALIKRVYNWAIQQELYHGQNPADRVQAPKVNNKKTECLSQTQLDSLLATLEKWVNRPAALIVKFALHTGLRQDEILGLQWKQVDLEKEFVRLTDPKGKPATIPLSAQAAAILKQAKNHLPSPDCPYAYPNKHGRKRTNFHKTWSRIRNQAGIQKTFRFHDLRHTYASYLASSGEVDLYTLQKLLNHQSPQMTQRYAHLLDEALRRGANVADKVFARQEKKKPGKG